MSPNSGNDLNAFSTALADAAEQGGRSVVLVNARRRVPSSGIAYSSDLILTADHTIEREEEISVLLPDGRQVKAALAGRDPNRDLALLRLAEPAAAQAQVPQALPRVGEITLALGRPDGSGVQASLGVVSAVGGPVRVGRGKTLEQYLRTDTIPYPGFSGGALVNVRGEVVGINTSGLAAGMLLTIPARIAWEAAAALNTHGRIPHGYLGVRSQLIQLSSPQLDHLGRKQDAALLVVHVETDSPAAQAGLMVGDIITGLSGQPVSDHDDLQAYLGSNSIGQALPVEILRGGQLTTVTVTIGERN